MDGDRTAYEKSLCDAYELGRRDGRAAAGSGERRPGRPPAGLPLNGPRWYAAGFRAGLAEQAAEAAMPGSRRAASRTAVPSRAG
jgi:hypothetical protein